MDYSCPKCANEQLVSFDEYMNGAVCGMCGSEMRAKDDRGTLFYEMARIIRAKQPKAFLIENVKNMVAMKTTFATIIETLENEGYHVTYQVLNTMEVGNIPQNRERVFIVGFKEEKQLEAFDFPKKQPLTRTIMDITKPHVKKPDKYYYKPGTNYYEMIEKDVVRKDTVYQIRRIYVRENQSNVCPTLTANMGTGGHNVPIIRDDFGYRKLTPHETLELQGFPEDFKIPDGMADSHIYKQAGNAVTVPVVSEIAKKIIKALR
jgi:DNA (cytosine-5)-methyltransferase 1